MVLALRSLKSSWGDPQNDIGPEWEEAGRRDYPSMEGRSTGRGDRQGFPKEVFPSKNLEDKRTYLGEEVRRARER